jgi:nucleotide-binding universal stress UspA family protein
MTPLNASATGRPTILAGFDGSDSGLDAVTLARALAEATGAGLVVANVYPYHVVATPTVALEPDVEDRLSRRAGATIGAAESALSGFDDWGPRVFGAAAPARGLLELAHRENAALIVVGATHRHGLGRVVPGTTAEKLLGGSACPIALAPAGWARRGDAGLRRIGAAFDGSPESVAALETAAGLATAAGGAVRALAVFDAPSPAHPWFGASGRQYHEVIAELRAGLVGGVEDAVAGLAGGAPVETWVADGDPVEVLADESSSLDLLVVGSRGYGPVRSVILGTVTAALVSRARCPLLVVPRSVALTLAAPAAD